MTGTTFAVTALVAVASVAFAADCQPALRAFDASKPGTPNAVRLTAGPTEGQSPPVEDTVAAGKESTAIVNANAKKSKKRWGGLGWGR